jgi:hypothetical protein
MDFRLRRQSLLERAKRVGEKAFCEKNTQAKDIMRALAALYREMAEELEVSGLFERRFPPLDFADLAGGDQSISAGQSRGRCNAYRTRRVLG